MDFTRENNKNLFIFPSVSMLIVVMSKINLFLSLFFLSRLKLEEQRKALLQKLEETTKLTTCLHSQLKK